MFLSVKNLKILIPSKKLANGSLVLTDIKD